MTLHRPPAHRVPAQRAGALCAALLVLTAAACGGSDGDAEPADTAVETVDTDAPDTAVPETDAVDEDGAAAAAAQLDTARPCLDGLGWSVTVGDEATTGLTPDMMANFGIDAVLVFDDGAGTTGSIEAYASPTQADLAEDGYLASDFEYEVGREGDVLFKTIGAAGALGPIGACLRGEEPEVAVDEAAAPATASPTTAPPTTAPPTTEAPSTEPPATDPPATDPPATDPPTTDPEETDVAGLVPAPPDDLEGVRLDIFTNFANESLASQDVVFVGDCLADWVRSVPEGELSIFADPSADEEDLQPETIPLLNELFDCLDLDYLAGLFGDLNGVDVDCVTGEFEQLDLPAFVGTEGRDIDVVFRELSRAAATCA